MSPVLRFMRPTDIPQVVTIDRQAFETPWSARSYAYEISESSYSYMVVLESHPDAPPLQGWRRFVANLSRNGSHQSRSHIIGYGGLWHIMDEAHISTIATHPDWRGHGYGDVLLLAMIRRSIALKAAYIVLEVRVSNTVAQNLYYKYDFEIFATKRRYYRDNNEDAYDMRLNLDDPDRVTCLIRAYEAVKARRGLEDRYSTILRPRV
jgi:[ribosomal protein S18]-alanine N-acetyltransferase